MDIFEEGLDKYFKLARLLNQNAWPQVVNNAVVSGEARQILVGLAGLLKDQTPTSEENQSEPTLGPVSPAEDAVPSALQQDQESSQVDKSGLQLDESSLHYFDRECPSHQEKNPSGQSKVSVHIYVYINVYILIHSFIYLDLMLLLQVQPLNQECTSELNSVYDEVSLHESSQIDKSTNW